jgi:hypothetical protein
MKIDAAVKKSLIYVLLSLGLLVPCYLLFIWAQKAAFGTLNYSFSLVSLVLFIAVGFLFAKFQYKTEEALERVLFKARYDYRETLLRFSRDMVSIVDLETLSDNLLLTVGQALGVKKASLFLSDEIKGSLSLRASIGLNKDRLNESSEACDNLRASRSR